MHRTHQHDDGSGSLHHKDVHIRVDIEWDVGGTVTRCEVEQSPSVKDMSESNWLSWREAAARIGHGVVGLVKYELHIDRATGHVISARRNMCETCEYCVPCGNSTERKCCGRMSNVARATKSCGCAIEKKISIASESCPLDAPRW